MVLQSSIHKSLRGVSNGFDGPGFGTTSRIVKRSNVGHRSALSGGTTDSTLVAEHQ